jgi:hypothetical protein
MIEVKEIEKRYNGSRALEEQAHPCQNNVFQDHF